MTASTLAAVLLAWMVQVAPPERWAAAATYPEAQETAEERTERYTAIAGDVALVVAEEAPPHERRRIAAMLLAIAIRESGLARDVDAPSCSAARIARGGCDSGRAVSIWQIQGYRPETRQEAARTALRLVRRSLQACRNLPTDARLAAYAAGTCTSTKGQELSRDRMALTRRLLAR